MNEGIGPEIDFLRLKRRPSDAWVILQEILKGYVPDYPDRFTELMDPIERIFLIRHEAFYDPDLRLNARKSVADELATLDENQRDLLETEIVPIIAQAFNISRLVDSLRFRGNRFHQ